MDKGHDEPTEANQRAEPIRGHIVLDLGDVRRATMELPEARKALLRAGIIAGCAVVFLTLSAATTGGVGPILLVPISLTTLVVGGTYWGIRRAAARIIDDKTPAMRDITYEFDQTGFAITTPVTNLRAEWASVHHAHEGASTFFLYPSSTVYQLVPKRALRTEDVPRLRDLVRAHVVARPVKSSAVRLVILWVVLIAAFLAVWQFMDQSSGEVRGPGERSAPPR